MAAICHPKQWSKPLIDDRWNRLLPLIMLPAIVLTFYITASAHFGYTPRETYSYLQMARGFIGGDGLFGDGEQTTHGLCPLWILIISLGGKLGVDVFIAAKGIDLVFASLSLIVFYFLAYEMIRDVAVALSATVAFSVSARFLQTTGTGLEISLAVLLLLIVMRSCLRNEYFLATIMTVLLSLVRTEGLLLMMLILTDVFINSFDVKRALKMSVSLLLIYSIGLAPWLIYAFRAGITVIPHTLVTSRDGMDVITSVIISDGVGFIVLVVSTLMLITKMRRSESSNGWKEEERFYLFRQSMLGIGWIVLVLLAEAAGLSKASSNALVLVVPLVIACASLFLYYRVRRSRWSQAAYAAVFVFIALVIMQNQIVYRLVILPTLESTELVRDLK